MRLQTTKKNNRPITAVRHILEKFYAHDIDLHLFCIDFKKTFLQHNQKKAARITSELWDTQKDKTARENDT